MMDNEEEKTTTIVGPSGIIRVKMNGEQLSHAELFRFYKNYFIDHSDDQMVERINLRKSQVKKIDGLFPLPSKCHILTHRNQSKTVPMGEPYTLLNDTTVIYTRYTITNPAQLVAGYRERSINVVC